MKIILTKTGHLMSEGDLVLMTPRPSTFQEGVDYTVYEVSPILWMNRDELSWYQLGPRQWLERYKDRI
jgi:hypothetical protein